MTYIIGLEKGQLHVRTPQNNVYGMMVERPLVSFGRGPSGKLVKRESGVRTQRYV